MAVTLPAAPASPLPPVRFVKYYQKGSTDIAADQLAPPLQRRGFDAQSVFAHQLMGLRGAVLIFVKRADLGHLLRTRLAGNLLVIDPHDTLVFRRGIRWSWLYHGLIFRNRRSLEDFGRGRPGAVLIPHHWDQRHRPNQAPTDRLRLAFIGDPRSYPFPEPLPGVEAIFDDWFGRAPAFNAHVSIRQPGREFLYKPNMKVVTAAACRAVLITTRDASAVEHLGDDYPFYTEPDRPSVLAAIARAERMVGGPEWQRALAILEQVRARTTLERMTDLYVELVARLSGGAARPVPATSPSARADG
jgi:hypothetical protein